ncbi:MAG: winged helix-turn-helix transcriptional regulator [Acidimicrobiia bacterium]|nr:winged helix-turn-helix transcriptional regulator [Acidimicrobiia bacterium]
MTDWLTSEQQRAWVALQKMQLRLTGRLASDLAAHSGLSYQDYTVLVALTADPCGRQRPHELGTSLGWEKSRVSHHINRMVARGLVAKERCDSDGRGTEVVVTDQGRREIEAAAPSHVAAVRDLFIDVLTAEQLATIGGAAEAVLARLALDDR